MNKGEFQIFIHPRFILSTSKWFLQLPLDLCFTSMPFNRWFFWGNKYSEDLEQVVIFKIGLSSLRVTESIIPTKQYSEQLTCSVFNLACHRISNDWWAQADFEFFFSNRCIFLLQRQFVHSGQLYLFDQLSSSKRTKFYFLTVLIFISFSILQADDSSLERKLQKATISKQVEGQK